ncbi:NADH-quinone oxidoreductase subunit N [Granulicella arctica]|uniref:NADH-quinone oxidoreductase subunit N n=1 Tax=Granulicella arctica TaxID=940613 RepID=A0A7Y9PFC3_9BACT|nr:NADH-quinone oxidoreductase subunit N [Granulicella arctica]NYF78111.1 NADH-quinone oxidoreductase subunit N [Granulicella arctica]
MISYSQLLQLVMPEVIIAITALIVLAADLLLLRNHPTRLRFSVAAGLASIGCTGAILRLLLSSEQTNVLDGMLLTNPIVHFVQVALLVFTIITLLLSVDSTFTEHIGEFVLLILLATTGMLFLVGSQNILIIFISLELLSLSLYILTAFDKRSPQSSEAALKYFLFGGMSTAFLLFGFSLLYGLSNSTNLSQIAATIHAPFLPPLLIIAIGTTIIGFGFKVSAFPFHFWAPDVYQSAPIPAVAFISSASKVASFFIFFQVMTVGMAGSEGSAAWRHFAGGWVSGLAVIAALSMLFGNLVAIVQSSMRRLLAYSAIAHAGYMLLAIVSHTQWSLAALLYYVVTYGLATLGTIAVVGVVEKQTDSDHLSCFEGLSRRAPTLSLCLFIFLLSLSGIPPLAGFFGKFFLFSSTLAATHESDGLLWLIVIAIATSAVSLYYYLQVLKRVYVANPPSEADDIRVPVLTQAVVVLLAGTVVLLGCAPHLLLQWILEAIHIAGL